MKHRHEICPADELQPGDRRIVELDGISIGVFNVDGEYYALKNDCPHQRAPLCEGKIMGTHTPGDVGEYNWERDGEIIRCPWHGWEFDITDGESLFNPHRVRAKCFEARVEPHADARSDGSGESADDEQVETYGTELAGDEPPVDTYDVSVEEDMVVVYL